MQSPKVTLSPVNGVSKRIGYGVSSTPLSSPTPHAQNALFSPSRISPLRHPPRYFLSNASPARSPVTPVKSARAVVVQKSSGPLLASTRFNVNLGTYTDSRSPGLSSRIVQYDNEAKEKLAPTHQAKYGSPGVFPVVHFFKKEIPVISPKAKRVTVRLASPDGNFYSTSKYSRCLSSNEALSEIRNGRDGEVRQANTSTKSVLDALKEISRKRMHTSTDFETNQEGSKRQRVDCTNGAYENNKRAREESPPVQEPPDATTAAVSTQSASKKICVVDVLAASYTSSNLLKEQLEKGLKRQTELEEESQKSKRKEMKLINAETQTQNVEEAPKLTEKLQEEINTTGKLDKPDTAELERKEEVQGSPARYANIFDEKRLEVNRKNKLATLLSAITGEPPKLIPHDGGGGPSEQKDGGHKLTSILSPQNKPKHDKHVSFNLPPEESEPEKKEEVAREPTVKNDAVVEPAKSNLNSTGEVSNLVASSTAVNSIMQVTTALPDAVVSSAASIGEFKPQVTADTITSANVVNPPVASPSTPVGGFKYDLGKTASTSNVVATPGFSFGITQSKLISPTSQGSEGKTSETFNFGSKLPAFGAAPSISSPSSLGNAITPATSTVIPMLRSPTSAATSTSPFSINFGGASSSSTSLTTSAATTLTVSFPAMTSTPKFSTATTSTPMFGGTPTSTIAFGNAPPTSGAFNFGATTTSPAVHNFVGMAVIPTFGTASTSVASPNFGTTSSVPPPNFGTTTPSAAFNFGTAVTTVAAPSFGATSTSSGSSFVVAPTSSTAMFGIKSSISPPMFGTTSSASPPMFGTTSSTSAPTFGGSASTTSAPMFGTTTSSATPMFGTTTSSATPMFGTTTSSATPMFGTTSSTPVFGGGVPPSTSAPAFGTATVSAFNSVPNFASGFNSRGNFNTTTVATTTAPFMSATISTPTFTNSALTFGTPATTFGASDAMFVSQASSGGGITKPPAFGFSSAPSLPFRTNLTTSAPTFGTNQVTSAPSNFRTNPVVTSAPPPFGTNSAPAFGTNPVTSIPPTFGTPAPPSFGSNLITSTSTSTPMFGANPNNNGVVPFGSSAAPSGFGTFNSSATPAAFSAPVATSSSGFATSKPFNFVGSNAAFAGNPTTSFNFTTPTASTSIFNTPKTTHSFTSGGFGSNPNQNVVVGFGSPTSPPNPFGQAPNAFPFQASPNVAPFDTNKNAAAAAAFNNNSFNSFGGNNAPGPGPNQQMFVSGEPQNVGFNSPPFQFNSAAPANNTNAQQGAGIFTFGSNNQQPAAPSSGVFTFGSGDTQKPNFNFSGGGGSNMPAPAAAFGGNAPGSYVNNFGSSPAGMFSIGSGSSTTNRSRMQFKVKKRN